MDLQKLPVSCPTFALSHLLMLYSNFHRRSPLASLPLMFPFSMSFIGEIIVYAGGYMVVQIDIRISLNTMYRQHSLDTIKLETESYSLT